MTSYVALLRAVNVGGTGKLPMADLRSLCCDLGFARVETYIASGNVVFASKAPAARVKSDLEARLLDYAGKRVDVVVRTASEMQAVLEANPFPKAPAQLHLRDLPRRAATARRAQTRRRRERRGDTARQARDLRLLRQRDGTVEAQDSGCQMRHGAQHEYGRQARRDGFAPLINSPSATRIGAKKRSRAGKVPR